MNKLLVCKNIAHEYQPGKGAVDISLEIAPGEIVGFLGPNGAGKTTTLRMVMGLLNKDHGEIKLFGKEQKSFADFPTAYKNIGFLPSEPAYYNELNAQQMFEYATILRGNRDGMERSIAEYSSRLKLDLDKKISKLSLGNKRKIGIILAILGNPKLIVMDEPTSGLDPLVQREVLEILKEKAAKGTGVLLSSHNLSEIETICDRVIVIKDAKIIFTGTLREIKSQKQKRIEFKITNKQQLDRILKSGETTEVNVIEDYASLLTPEFMNITKALIAENIEDFTVTNPTLEEMFINYYK
jgi:ABC-2 type transport system ATP-binding protein